MKGNMLFRIIGKLGYIFVVIGFCMPIACDMNGFKLADFMMGDDKVMFGVLTIVMLVVAVIGVILGIVFLTGKKIHAVVDWITAAICIVSGLIVYLGCLKDDSVELQSGAYVILVGWVVTLIGEILAGVVKFAGGGAFKNMAIFLVVMLISIGCGNKEVKGEQANAATADTSVTAAPDTVAAVSEPEPEVNPNLLGQWWNGEYSGGGSNCEAWDFNKDGTGSVTYDCSTTNFKFQIVNGKIKFSEVKGSEGGDEWEATWKDLEFSISDDGKTLILDKDKFTKGPGRCC